MKKRLSPEDSSLTNGTIAFVGKRAEGWLATLPAMPSAAKVEAPLKHRATPHQTRNLLDSTSLRFHSLEKISIQSFPKISLCPPSLLPKK